MESRERIAGGHQHLTFTVGGEEYALSIQRVREIIEFGVVTKVPTLPPHVRGVINLRGRVVMVADLGVKLGLPESPITRRTCIVIVEADPEGEKGVMGIVADSVNQVLDLPPAEIEPPPAFGTRIRPEFLLGMGKAGLKFLLVLDLDKVLSAADVRACDSGALPGRDGMEAETDDLDAAPVEAGSAPC